VRFEGLNKRQFTLILLLPSMHINNFFGLEVEQTDDSIFKANKNVASFWVNLDSKDEKM
jgi:hypothetical protein